MWSNDFILHSLSIFSVCRYLNYSKLKFLNTNPFCDILQILWEFHVVIFSITSPEGFLKLHTMSCWFDEFIPFIVIQNFKFTCSKFTAFLWEINIFWVYLALIIFRDRKRHTKVKLTPLEMNKLGISTWFSFENIVVLMINSIVFHSDIIQFIFEIYLKVKNYFPADSP